MKCDSVDPAAWAPGIHTFYDDRMELLLIQASGADAAKRILRLADEATEDPRCDLVLPGADDLGVVLATTWHKSVAAEVAEGLRADGFEVRRMALVEV